ncbi:hypothetical protein BKA82DRAFT_17431 [Pisolithus tinctorius]|uniref:C3HC-type domain-containing protein n=1 Tax=Pisolithus tinctorius Marx 270 TaxID=870435 RepID=A0A0C3PK02_PISTI|nr:hypothetical protein BKA82DRAFT_17431 [Pisolithus tinctorius]KIO14525.1 hypothetical protein M404DRAFT_17431 [Pisolithus tinctorius Marx 270]
MTVQVRDCANGSGGKIQTSPGQEPSSAPSDDRRVVMQNNVAVNGFRLLDGEPIVGLETVMRATIGIKRHSSQSSPSKQKTATLTYASSEYRPSLMQSFLSRLATYKLSTYANKPLRIDAVAATKCKRINDGKDRLVCGICDVSWVLAGRDSVAREVANALVKKQCASFVDVGVRGERDDPKIPFTTSASVPEFHDSRLGIASDPMVSENFIKHPPGRALKYVHDTLVSEFPSFSGGTLIPPPEGPPAVQVDESAPHYCPSY